MSAEENDAFVNEFTFDHKGGSYHSTFIRAGFLGTERIEPPAGEGSAFEIPRWRNRVEVTCSPTGRSVQVFVNGEKWGPLS